MTYKINDNLTLAFGGSMMTGMAGGKDLHSDEGNPNLYYNMHDKEDYQIRGGTMYGGVIYKGQSYFIGNNSEKRLHDIQNFIHSHWPIRYSKYFRDRGLPSQRYSYYGGYHPNYLFY